MRIAIFHFSSRGGLNGQTGTRVEGVPKLYHQVAAYHNWPTEFVHLDDVATRIPCHGSVRGHQGLCDHATTLARKALAFNTLAQKPSHPCDEDEESDDDDEDSRNLQAHVVLKHLYV